jgi:hypothetical protein
MIKQFFKSIEEFAKYIFVAIGVGLVISGAAEAIHYIDSFVYSAGGSIGFLVYSLFLGVILIAANKARQQAKLNYTVDKIAAQMKTGRPSADDVERFLNTPAGLDLLYRIVRNKRQRREEKLATETTALTEAVKANRVPSEGNAGGLKITTEELDERFNKLRHLELSRRF